MRDCCKGNMHALGDAHWDLGFREDLLPLGGVASQESLRAVRLDRLDPVRVGQREGAKDAARLPLVAVGEEGATR